METHQINVICAMVEPEGRGIYGEFQRALPLLAEHPHLRSVTSSRPVAKLLTYLTMLSWHQTTTSSS